MFKSYVLKVYFENSNNSHAEHVATLHFEPSEAFWDVMMDEAQSMGFAIVTDVVEDEPEDEPVKGPLERAHAALKEEEEIGKDKTNS